MCYISVFLCMLSVICHEISLHILSMNWKKFYNFSPKLTNLYNFKYNFMSKNLSKSMYVSDVCFSPYHSTSYKIENFLGEARPHFCIKLKGPGWNFRNERLLPCHFIVRTAEANHSRNILKKLSGPVIGHGQIFLNVWLTSFFKYNKHEEAKKCRITNFMWNT
jgi:hypothetical protein